MPNLPALPQTFLDTTYTTPSGATIVVASGGNLQAALNAANPGDLISVAAGATFTGPFTLPNKSGSSWIYVQSSAYGSLPSPGTRVSPSDAAVMPKVVVNSDVSTLQTVAHSHHFRFVGIEFRPAAGIAVTRVVWIGAGETSAANLPHDITFDRCYVHGDSTASAMRGIVLDSTSSAVIDSYVTDIRHTTTDATAVWSSNGSGPFKIANNYLAGSGQSIMFGGQDPSITNLVPADIEIRGNYMTKPLSWRIGDPLYAGTHWQIKNLLEMKNAKRVLVDGNILAYDWPDDVGGTGQTGSPIFFSPRNQDGGASWCTVEDITFTHNIVRHTSQGWWILATDNNFTSQTLRRVLVQNNLFHDVGAFASMPTNGIMGLWLGMANGGPIDVTIDHNTVFQTASPVDNETFPATPSNFTFTNTITPNGPSGMGTMAQLGSGLVLTKNVIMDGNAANYLAGNFFPAGTTPIVNAFYGGSDFHLVPGSPYAGAGTDGKDIGADIDAINAATVSALTGAPPVNTVAFPGSQVQRTLVTVRTW